MQLQENMIYFILDEYVVKLIISCLFLQIELLQGFIFDKRLIKTRERQFFRSHD